MRYLAALALLCAAVPAQADYIFDPTDLPKGFACEPELSHADCEREKRQEAWFARHGDAYGLWLDNLMFNTNFFFSDLAPEIDMAAIDEKNWSRSDMLGVETPNLVDAAYFVALRRYSHGWAFAVDMVCVEQGKPNPLRCAPKLRMTSFLAKGEHDEAAFARLKYLLPTSEAEVALTLQTTAKWQEADLRTCPGAMKQLLALPAQRGEPIWHPRYSDFLQGEQPKEPDELIITADGAGVYVRASGRGDPSNGRLSEHRGTHVVYSQWNGGTGMAWALKMASVVQPCLKPATVPAPWDKVLAEQAKAAR